jgi:hypothetical protein
VVDFVWPSRTQQKRSASQPGERGPGQMTSNDYSTKFQAQYRSRAARVVQHYGCTTARAGAPARIQNRAMPGMLNVASAARAYTCHFDHCHNPELFAAPPLALTHADHDYHLTTAPALLARLPSNMFYIGTDECTPLECVLTLLRRRLDWNTFIWWFGLREREKCLCWKMPRDGLPSLVCRKGRRTASTMP